MKHTPEKLNTSSNDKKNVLFESKKLVSSVGNKRKGSDKMIGWAKHLPLAMYTVEPELLQLIYCCDP